MTAVRNNLAGRAVAVRTGFKADGTGDKIVEIPPLTTMNVEGFSTKLKGGGADTFHQHLVDTGQITVGAGAGEVADDDDSHNDQLQADITDAQNAVKDAEDAFAAAVGAQKEDGGDTPQAKKAVATAAQDLKSARAQLEKAEKAFGKG